MARISFVVVLLFAMVVMALPAVMGQNWQDLMGQAQAGDLSATINEAKKAIGAAEGTPAGQEALNDYFGGGGGGAASAQEATDAAASSLADWIETAKNAPPVVDSPIAAPEDFPASDVLDDDSDDSFSPPKGAPTQAPSNNAPSQAPTTEAPSSYAPSQAPVYNAGEPSEAPDQYEYAPVNAPSESHGSTPAEAPQYDDGEDDDDDVDDSKKGAPAQAPSNSNSNDSDSDDDESYSPSNAPSDAPSSSYADDNE